MSGGSLLPVLQHLDRPDGRRARLVLPRRRVLHLAQDARRSVCPGCGRVSQDRPVSACDLLPARQAPEERLHRGLDGAPRRRHGGAGTRLRAHVDLRGRRAVHAQDSPRHPEGDRASVARPAARLDDLLSRRLAACPSISYGTTCSELHQDARMLTLPARASCAGCAITPGTRRGSNSAGSRARGSTLLTPCCPRPMRCFQCWQFSG